MSTTAELYDEGEMPGFDGAVGWLNSPPLTPTGLRGRPVLVMPIVCSIIAAS